MLCPNSSPSSKRLRYLKTGLPAAVLGFALACAGGPSLPTPPNPSSPFSAPWPPAPSAPGIFTQPRNQQVAVGMSAVFSVTAIGYPLHYQWYQGIAPIQGTDSPALTFVPSLGDNGATFSVKIFNDLGSVTSSSVTLTVIPAPQVSLLAGTPMSAGTGATLHLGAPQSVCAGPGGSLLVSESGGSTLQKISPTGLMTPFAGAEGMPGAADGPWPLTRFNGPTGMVRDGAGNTYVADTGNHTIRVISLQGMSRVLAGSPGSPGSNDGRGTSAGFNRPTGLALDLSGSLLVADTGNNLIRMVDPQGNVTTVAGSTGNPGYADGDVAGALFQGPSAVAEYDATWTDSDGNLQDDLYIYVCDTGNDAIRIIHGGSVFTLAGGTLHNQFHDGQGPAAAFKGPMGICLDGAGNALVGDTGNHAIRAIDFQGKVTTLAGSPGQTGAQDGSGDSASFNGPQGLALDASGNLFVADTGNGLIRKVTPAGAVSTLSGVPAGPGAAQGNPDGFNVPAGLALDGAGNVIVADCLNHIIRSVSPGGQVTLLAGSPGLAGAQDGAQATFNGPAGLAVDAAGNIFVADWLNSTIRVIAPSGQVRTLAGQAGAPGNADGTGSQAAFSYPRSLALDGNGNLYVADTGNGAIRMVTPGGVVTTPSTFQNSRAVPTAVAVDAAGHLYVGSNLGVMEYTPSRLETLLPFPLPEYGKFVPTSPSALALDPAGNLFVSDALCPVVWQEGPLFGWTSLTAFLGDPILDGFKAGTFIPGSGTPASGTLPSANGLVVDPASGHLYVSTDQGILSVVF